MSFAWFGGFVVCDRSPDILIPSDRLGTRMSARFSFTGSGDVGIIIDIDSLGVLLRMGEPSGLNEK